MSAAKIRALMNKIDGVESETPKTEVSSNVSMKHLIETSLKEFELNQDVMRKQLATTKVAVYIGDWPQPNTEANTKYSGNYSLAQVFQILYKMQIPKFLSQIKSLAQKTNYGQKPDQTQILDMWMRTFWEYGHTNLSVPGKYIVGVQRDGNADALCQRLSKLAQDYNQKQSQPQQQMKRAA